MQIQHSYRLRCILAALLTTGAMAQNKPVIAVKTFENPANYAQSTIGDALTEILVTELSATGKFRILERSNVDELMKEIQFGSSDFAKTSSFAQKGQMLGAQYLLMGKVSNISYSETAETKQVINLFGPNTTKRVYQQRADARVDFRLVDIATGESLVSEAGEAHKTNTGDVTEMPLWQGWARTGRGTAEFSSSLFGRTTIEAVKDVVRKLNALSTTISGAAAGAQISKEVGGLGQATGTILGDEGGGLWIVGLGSRSGLRKGDRLRVTHENVIRDQTGKEIYRKPAEAGVLEVADVSQPDAAEARLLQAVNGTTGTPIVGDTVRADLDYAKTLRGGGSPSGLSTPAPAAQLSPGAIAAASSDGRLDELLRRGASMIDDRFWSQALEVFNQAAALNPNDPRVLQGQTLTHYMMKDFLDGDASAEKLLKSGGTFTIPVSHYHSTALCTGQLAVQNGKLSYKGSKDSFDIAGTDLMGAEVHRLSKPLMANEKAPDWSILEIHFRDAKREEKFQLLPIGYAGRQNASGKNWASTFELGDNDALDAEKLEKALATLIGAFVK